MYVCWGTRDPPPPQNLSPNTYTSSTAQKVKGVCCQGLSPSTLHVHADACHRLSPPPRPPNTVSQPVSGRKLFAVMPLMRGVNYPSRAWGGLVTHTS